MVYSNTMYDLLPPPFLFFCTRNLTHFPPLTQTNASAVPYQTTKVGDHFQATDLPLCSSAPPSAQRALQDPAMAEEEEEEEEEVEGLVWRPSGFLQVRDNTPSS